MKPEISNVPKAGLFASPTRAGSVFENKRSHDALKRSLNGLPRLCLGSHTPKIAIGEFSRLNCGSSTRHSSLVTRHLSLPYGL
jgi:hypothetical protein